jgi:hypothetical protein
MMGKMEDFLIFPKKAIIHTKLLLLEEKLKKSSFFPLWVCA